MPFFNRNDAAEKLAHRLEEKGITRPLVLAVPRGAVPMGKVLADRLHGDLDIALVHKFGFPFNPEFALGSVTEEGDIFLGLGAERHGLKEEDIEQAALSEIAKLQNRRRIFTPNKLPMSPEGRTVIIVDDGIATGATMTAAVRSLKGKGADRIIIACPVASSDAVTRLINEGAEVEVLEIPEHFMSVSQFFEDFEQVSDEEVVKILSQERYGITDVKTEVLIAESDIELHGFLAIPEDAKGIVVFAHGSGSSRYSPRNQFVASALNEAGFGTLLLDLLEEHESNDRSKIFDIDLLAERLTLATRWLGSNPQTKRLHIGYFGASTGGGAALQAAAKMKDKVRAVVSRGGRPDLAFAHLAEVKAATLLIVGENDQPVIEMNKQAYGQLRCERSLVIVPGATHLFEEPGTLEEVAKDAAEWFDSHLVPNEIYVRKEQFNERSANGIQRL